MATKDEGMMDEFEEWWRSEFVGPGSAIGVDKEFARRIWLESARRADKRAREECEEICARLRSRDYCVDVRKVEREIRATIPEGPA